MNEGLETEIKYQVSRNERVLFCEIDASLELGRYEKLEFGDKVFEDLMGRCLGSGRILATAEPFSSLISGTIR